MKTDPLCLYTDYGGFLPRVRVDRCLLLQSGYEGSRKTSLRADHAQGFLNELGARICIKAHTAREVDHSHTSVYAQHF